MKDLVVSLLKKQISELSQDEISDLVEQPKDNGLGDYAFPCFVLAKTRKKNPIEIAKELKKHIKVSEDFEKIEAVGPYLNFFVNRLDLVSDTLQKVSKMKGNYGKQNLGGEKVMIEFSQANTHKAFHIGHVRGTSLGESLARLMEFCGDTVIRANYEGDTGMHVAKWLWCYMNYHAKEKLQKDESWIASIYVDAVKRLEEHPQKEEEVKEINRKLDQKSDVKLNTLWKKTRALSLEALEPVYKQLETKFDEYFFESQVEERGREMALDLIEKDIAKVSDGATIIDFKDHGAEQLGVWVLLRADETVLYSAKDIALAEYKFTEFGIDRSLYVVASEQSLHMQQLFKTLELMGIKQARDCKHFSFNLVRLPTGKMSSRTGDNVLYSEFMKELTELALKEMKERGEASPQRKRAEAVSVAALKYAMLKQDINKTIVFDKKEALKFEGDTGPYLLYTYARACSILRKSQKRSTKSNGVSDKEKELVGIIAQFPSVVEHAYKQLEPNTIAVYVHHLAQTFNAFYHSCKVIGSEEEAFRLSIVEATTQTLKNGLQLLGIPVIEKM